MKKNALFVIFMTVFVDLVGFGIIIPLTPFLSRKLGATPFEIGALMTVYSLMQFLMSPFWGSLSDRLGRRPIILVSLLVSSLSHLGFAFSTTLVGLFLARMFAGIGGANISTAMAYIADVTDKKDRSKGMGLIGAAFGLGFVLGPFLGGFFGELGTHFGSEPPLGKSLAAVVASAICFLNFVIAFFTLKESLSKENKESSSMSLSQKLILLKKYLFSSSLAGMLQMMLLFSLAVAKMEATLFLFVDDIYSWGMKEASYGFAFIGLVMVFTQGYLIRKWIPKYGETKLLLWGTILSLLGYIGIAFSNSILMLGFAVTLLAIGMGLFNPSMSGTVSLMSGPEEQGKVMGVYQSLSALGRIFGPLLGGFLYHEFGPRSPFFMACLFTLIVLVYLMRTYRELKKVEGHK